MLKTEQEVRTFLNKRPHKGQVAIEIRLLDKEIERLCYISSEYGKDNSRLSHEYRQRNNCWTPMEKWDTKDRVKFHNNQDKKDKTEKQITQYKDLLKLLKDYDYVEPEQLKLDFNRLNEIIDKALG